MKQILGLLVLALAVWGAVALFGGRPTTVATAVSHSSSQNCAACHAGVYEEWQSGPHADSWTGAAVRKLSENFSNQDCIDCHAPQPVFVTGIGQRVLPRTARRAEGVDCIACHALPDGRVAGSFTSDSVACLPTETVDLSRPEFCAGCHDQHQTVQQWKASRWANEGVSCIDCHMPWRDGTPGSGRHHGMHGGTDLAMLRRAVELTAVLATRADGVEGWRVSVENVGAGHSFPTDERSRAADVFWRPLDEPQGPWRHLYRFRSPYRFEAGIADTLLAAHEKRSFDVEEEVDGVRLAVTEPIEVVLLYKRSPHYRSFADPFADLLPTDPAIDPYASDVPRDAVVVHRLVLGSDEEAR
jgi:nitrate/TMAO reductase-like tetraheme cytochrome c subunit